MTAQENTMGSVRLQRSLTLPNDIETIPRLNEFIDTAAEETDLDPSLTMSLNLALEEAVVNVMNYAYPPGQAGTVDIEMVVSDTSLVFVISDAGRPFDPTQAAEADTTLSADERPIGGLGIYLVRHLMDDIRYERLDDRNVLTLTKRFRD